MTYGIYRYHFVSDVSVEEIQSTLLLSVVATEALHGEAQVRLDAFYSFDPQERRCEIDCHHEGGTGSEPTVCRIHLPRVRHGRLHHHPLADSS